jgi:hypothetical protein
MKRHFTALGRLKSGEMNKTEQAYAQRLDIMFKAGEIQWYKFEGVKLKLADNTFLTVDFFVLNKDNELEAHEVKGGFITEDGKVKLKVAAAMYPFKFFQWQYKDKQWSVTEY